VVTATLLLVRADALAVGVLLPLLRRHRGEPGVAAPPWQVAAVGPVRCATRSRRSVGQQVARPRQDQCSLRRQAGTTRRHSSPGTSLTAVCALIGDLWLEAAAVVAGAPGPRSSVLQVPRRRPHGGSGRPHGGPGRRGLRGARRRR
jgi:hypothetical protein